jgi:hypothetical protein
MDGACVTKAPDAEAAHIWTGRTGAEIDLLSTEVAAAELGEDLAAPGVTLVCFGDDVDAAVERLVRAGGITKPQAVTLGAPPDDFP